MDIALASMSVRNGHQAHQRSASIVEVDNQQDTDDVVELRQTQENNDEKDLTNPSAEHHEVKTSDRSFGE